MDYKVEVFDWTQINSHKNYGVSINGAAVFQTNNLDDAHIVSQMVKSAYNQGLRKMMLLSQQNVREAEVDDSAFSERVEYVVTPEMQRLAK